MNTPLDSFETKLLAALRDHVDETAAEDDTRTPDPSTRRRRLALGAGIAAAAAIGAVVLLPGVGARPAYSVQEGNAGTIEVEVNRFEDAPGLEEALAEHGIDAEITYVPDGGQCAPGRYVPIQRSDGGISLSMGSELFRIVLEPGTVREGETLVIDASILRLPDGVDPETGHEYTDHTRVIVEAEVTHGPVPACTPTPAGGA